MTGDHVGSDAFASLCHENRRAGKFGNADGSGCRHTDQNGQDLRNGRTVPWRPDSQSLSRRGVQFETDVLPTSVVPPASFGVTSQVLWREGEPGVSSDGTLACIPVTSIWKRYR